MLGIFRILFGLRYVAYVAADQPGTAAFWLKRLGLNGARILHGPVLAVSFFLGVLAVAVSGTQMMWAESYKSVLWTQVVLAGCCSFALITSSIGWSITRSRVFERFWFWVNVTAMFVAGLMLIKAGWLDGWVPGLAFHEGIRPGLIWYCRVLVVLLGLLWFAEIVVLIAMGICWAVALFHRKAYRPALHVAFLLPALAVGIWGQMLPMSWLSAKAGIKNLFRLPEFDTLFAEAIPLLGVQLLMCMILLMAAAFVGARFVLWRKRNGIPEFQHGARAPRLIVHGGIQFTLGFCTFVGASLVFGIGMYEFHRTPNEQIWFSQFMADANKYAMAVLLPASLMLVFVLPRLTPVFDIVLDVVNHFHFRATNIGDTLDDEDEFDIKETTFEQGTLFFSRRDAIHCRMKRILSFYRDTLEHRPDLILVSHSQGTMVAIEVLNDPELAWINNRFASVSLVTMGSPFTNLYQHYFSHCYPALDQPYWSSLRKRLDRWVNIFRIDDPVGTEIEFPGNRMTPTEALQARSDGHCLADDSEVDQRTYSNHPVGCRGHVSYWSDREVLDILRAELLQRCRDERHQRVA